MGAGSVDCHPQEHCLGLHCGANAGIGAVVVFPDQLQDSFPGFRAEVLVLLIEDFDTVETETPAKAAISRIVTDSPPF